MLCLLKVIYDPDDIYSAGMKESINALSSSQAFNICVVNNIASDPDDDTFYPVRLSSNQCTSLSFCHHILLFPIYYSTSYIHPTYHTLSQISHIIPLHIICHIQSTVTNYASPYTIVFCLWQKNVDSGFFPRSLYKQNLSKFA